MSFIKLKSFSFSNCGPFSSLTTLELADPLTILTGKNDVGKSSVIRFIGAALNLETISVEQVNRQRVVQFATDPTLDTEVFCRAEYTSSTPDKSRCAKFLLSKKGSKHWIQEPGSSVVKMPRCINLTSMETIRSEISLSDACSTELRLLALGMGGHFDSAGFIALDNKIRQQAIRGAESKLNEKLLEITPCTFYKFELSHYENTKIGISVSDSRGSSAIDSRGDGTQKIFQYMAHLLLANSGSEDLVILIDEVETALHPDMQRRLRDFLFQLAANPRLTIIYSTHSPVMLNAIYPETVRVVTAAEGRDSPTIRTKSFGDNLKLVRAELGLFPSDSLIYADTTLIVEGPSEYCTIGKILKLLSETEPEIDKETLDRVLGAICIHNGEGDNIPATCRLIQSYMAKPVVLFDGDKNKVKLNAGIAKTILDTGSEIEDVVPLDKYLQGVKEASMPEKKIDFDLVDAYKSWLKAKIETDEDYGKRMTSKKVDDWLIEAFSASLKKPISFMKAIENCEASDIEQTGKFVELFGHLKNSVGI